MLGFGRKKKKENVAPEQSKSETKPEVSQEKQEEIKKQVEAVQKAAAAVPLGPREMKYLKKARYQKFADTYPSSYVIQHKTRGMIAEIKACSSFQACQFLGWKPQQVKIVQEKDIRQDKKNSEEKYEADTLKRKEEPQQVNE